MLDSIDVSAADSIHIHLDLFSIDSEIAMSYPATAGVTLDTSNRGPRRGGLLHGYVHGQVHAQHDASVPQAAQYPAAQHHDGALGAMMSQFGNLALPAAGIHQGASPVAVGGHAGYVAPADASLIYGAYAAPMAAPFNVGQMESIYGAAIPTGYVHQGSVAGGYAPYVVPYTPARPVYPERLDHGLRDVPNLGNRRSSSSTNATESLPGTPFFGSLSDRHNAPPRVVSGDRSSSSYTPPSPPPTGSNDLIGTVASKDAHILDAELEVLVKQDPAIPAAVPAVFTTPDQRKTLEQCLENRIEGNRNVYIRGLHPTTDDELLLKYAVRFGEVEQSKAIIDTFTGACKGFGFAKFKDVRDSEKCIRGFYLLGYEPIYSNKESFNARLKAEGDENSTNLYISNLPKTVTEAQLISIFDPYVIISSKILRDSMGNSRGVGFARFESRDVCDEIIKKFHGQPIERDGFVMQVRYADTPAQKELKRITAERRQYRTNEYNIGAYGTMAVGINPSIYSHQPVWNRRAGFTGNNAYHTNGGAQGTHAGMVNGGGRGPHRQQSAPVPGTTPSDDARDDEGDTAADSPTKTKDPVESSPSAKKENV